MKLPSIRRGDGYLGGADNPPPGDFLSGFQKITIRIQHHLICWFIIKSLCKQPLVINSTRLEPAI
jgi:hypothetical protein